MNIPNLLTLFRLLLVPLYVVVFKGEQDTRLLSALIFVVAGLTDVLDGYLARKLNMTTKWGQLLDPLADKCMQLAVIITLFTAKIVPLWFIVLLIAKEGIMILASLFLYSRKTYVKANKAGKLNTVFLFAVMTLLLLKPSMSPVFKNILLGIAAALALLASTTYLYLYFVHNQRFRKYALRTRKGDSK